MAYNLFRTMKQGSLVANEAAQAMPLEPVHAVVKEASWHRTLERKPIQLMILALAVILIGSFVELMPTLTISSNIPTIASVKPYTPLELQGRDIYIREGCSNCHSQTVRPFGLKRNVMASIVRPGSLFTTIRSYGGQNVPGPIWLVKGVSTATPGTIIT